jgi:Domain of unknown function (DUF1937)
MLLYLATPYTKYPAGREAAFRRALEITAKLMSVKIPVWSPIAYTHQFVAEGLPVEAVHWEFLDKAMTDACDGCLVYTMEGWDESAGVAKELEWFRAQNKPVWYIAEDDTLADVQDLLQDLEHPGRSG